MTIYPVLIRIISFLFDNLSSYLYRLFRSCMTIYPVTCTDNFVLVPQYIQLLVRTYFSMFELFGMYVFSYVRVSGYVGVFLCSSELICPYFSMFELVDMSVFSHVRVS